MRRGEKPLVSAMDADSVVTSSSQLSLSADVVMGLAGSKNTSFVPQ
jgi:hypothetical protein